MNADLEGTTIDVTKIMGTEPRRITGVKLHFHFPENAVTDDKQKAILERVALTCPVAKSLHPDIVQDVTFEWK
jgi:uncharacterized OsmC-like protein